MKPGRERVVFGHMHEDHSIELSLVNLLPVKRALVIASGGDLAFALAGSNVDVTAVDSNPAQIELVREKMRCPDNLMTLCFCGRVDRLLRFGGPFLAWLLDWPRLRAGNLKLTLTNRFEELLHLVIFLVHGTRAAKRVDRPAIRLIRRRLDKAMRQPNAERNPLLQVLLGKRFESVSPDVWSEQGIAKWRGETARIVLKAADIGQVLSDTAGHSLGLISVSNLPDVLDEDAWQLLVERAAAALAPGGYLIVRSMLRETIETKSDANFSKETVVLEDRSPICPVIWIGRLTVSNN